MRVMGLDVGDKYIGVALSDPTGRFARPLSAVARVGLERDIAALLRLAEENEAKKIVVGLPRSLSGALGPQAQKVQRFAQALHRRTPIPIVYWDERLTTVEAKRLLADLTGRGPRQKGALDTAAATIILQNYLNYERHQAKQEKEADQEAVPSEGTDILPPAPSRPTRRKRGSR